MLTPTERQEKIDKIRKLPAALEAAVRGMTDQQLDTPYREGGWTVRQVVHHLADSHMNAFVRMKLILTEERPTVKPYDQERWAELPDVQRMPIGSSLMMLQGLHERWCMLLERVPETAWSRAAVHPESGEMTLERLLTIYASHGEKHIGHILGLKNSRGW
jgi:uncharacterized damage-inducible protein DinB